MKKKSEKNKKDLEELGEQYIINKLKKSIELFQKEKINTDEMDFLATTAYEFFLVAHWSILDYVKDEEKIETIYELVNTLYKNLIAPPD